MSAKTGMTSRQRTAGRDLHNSETGEVYIVASFSLQQLSSLSAIERLESS